MATVASGTQVVREPSPLTRWAPATGIAFVVLFVVGAGISNQPNADASDRKWLDFFATSSHQARMVIAGFLFVLAGLCFLSFLTVLWSRIAATRDRPLSPLPLVAAGAAAAGFAVGGVLNAIIAGGMIFGSLHEPSAEFLRTTSQFSFPVIAVGGMWPAALALGSIVVQANGAGLMSRGLMTVGLLVALVTFASFVFFPMIVTVIWVIVLSIIELRRTPAAVR